MPRLPFNPDRLPDIDPGPPAHRERGACEAVAPQALTVTQATELVRDVLGAGLPGTLQVVGEVSNVSERGHWYLSLKDESNVLSCVMWASDAKRCAFVPQRGQRVVATGRVDYYGPQGRLQFYIQRLEPVGQGSLELRYRQLCEELRKLGYFEEARKRAMPAFPEHIAVITSASGAALQDVIRTARHRWGGVRLSVFDVRVQGEGATQEIARAVSLLSDQHEQLRIDALILTRGGGSLEDLWAFNERIVADAVFRCRVPIAVGVGHETDTTIAELVADLRCSTPTQAAARLVGDAAGERQRLDHLSHRLTHALGRHGQHARTRLEALASHPIFRRPAERLGPLRARIDHLGLGLGAAFKERLGLLRCALDEHRHALSGIEPGARLDGAVRRVQALEERLRAAWGRGVSTRRELLGALERQLSCVGHHSVLTRGYTYTTDSDGRVLHSAEAAESVGLLKTHFQDGAVESEVIRPINRLTAASKPARAGRAGRARTNTGAGPGLFEGDGLGANATP